jgi:hypothetical protein
MCYRTPVMELMSPECKSSINFLIYKIFMAEIKQLIDNDSELKIYPITSTAAVLDNEGVNV